MNDLINLMNDLMFLLKTVRKNSRENCRYDQHTSRNSNVFIMKVTHILLKTLKFISQTRCEAVVATVSYLDFLFRKIFYFFSISFKLFMKNFF